MIVNNFRSIMPIAKDINEAIFNNQKKHFLLILTKPDIFFEDINCISKIEEEWKQFNAHIQKIILKEYKKSSELRTLSLLLINEGINNNECNIKLLNFLLSKGFEFNNEDMMNLQLNNLIPKPLIKEKKSNLFLIYINLFIKNMTKKIVSFLKLNPHKDICHENLIHMIDKIPITLHNVLFEHINCLPVSLQEKLLNDIILVKKNQEFK